MQEPTQARSAKIRTKAIRHTKANAPSTVRPLARDPRVLIGLPFPLGFGLDGRLLLARRGRVYVLFTIIRHTKANRNAPNTQETNNAARCSGAFTHPPAEVALLKVEAIQNPGTSQPASVFCMTKKMIDFVRMDKLNQTLEVRWAGLLSWPRRRRCRRFRRYVVSLNHRRRLIS